MTGSGAPCVNITYSGCPPRLALSGPTEHLGEVREEAEGLPVSAAVDHGAGQRPNIVFGDAAHRGLAECRRKVFVKKALQFSIAIFALHAIQLARLGPDPERSTVAPSSFLLTQSDWLWVESSANTKVMVQEDSLAVSWSLEQKGAT